ncbi:MucR family transcriptional regulator [Sphingomonas sp. AP4-R1]|uniref:MucR family transcriptional regulator n=1 Tax=Sphingomonas sp. AP4-R1 TaxID=2735134 RepID=UPI0014936F75|nr:MucR family transcriptional regulator [Sphingomonas sp. AP4-R1]QJU57395.1 MucR family transcriptional regulator [Sphingomonas sp. AP4-R1]
MEEDLADDALLTLTADIVAAHVANNHVATTAVPELIAAVHDALSNLGKPIDEPAAAKAPAVSIRSSVKPNYIVCLEDGAKLKTMKRYLRTKFDMTPEQYREKWGLPRDYPMVAPSYTEQRSALAKSFGLGRKPKEIVEEVAAPVVKAVKTARKTIGIAAAKAAAVAHLSTTPKETAKPARKPRAQKAKT